MISEMASEVWARLIALASLREMSHHSPLTTHH